MKKILTIAGSDSGGGAGIQQDLKVFTILGSYGCSVITALTAQNTRGVFGIFEVTPEFVKKQIECVINDIRPDAIKTGMLFSSEIILSISDVLRKHPQIPLICDPVMVAKGGEPLLQSESISCFMENILPIADVITPNIPEAEALSGTKITTVEEMKALSKALYKRLKQSPYTAVIIKGGHLEGTHCPDVICHSDRIDVITSEKVNAKNTHGTGCTFSAALSHYVASNYCILEACKKAKEFVTISIKNSEKIGEGIGPTNPYANLEIRFQKNEVLDQLKRALSILKSYEVGNIIPEIQSNIGYALYGATTINDVAAFPGRIVRLRNGVTSIADPEFGASSHIARIILTVMKRYPYCRSAMNIRLDRNFILNAQKAGFVISYFDRDKEPDEIKNREGSSLNWGIEYALDQCKDIPDLIYDNGALGKEPVIRILGKDPVDVVTKALKISGFIA